MINLIGKPKDDCAKCTGSGFELQQNRKDESVMLQIQICNCVRFEVSQK